MAFDSFGGARPPRRRVDVSHLGLKCAKCNVDITELPFEPRGDRPVYCNDCARQGRETMPRPERKIVDVSAMGLKCADCGADVAELPFEPTPDRPVYCRDCNRNRRQSFRSRY